MDKMTRIETGISIYEVGEGEPILVIPGGPGVSSKLYRKYLNPLTANGKLIFWDYRGTGLSLSLPNTTYTFENDHADMIAVIQALGLKRFSIFAHSYGGLHAVSYASKNPHAVSKLILASTTTQFAQSSQIAFKNRQQNLSVSEFESWMSLAEKISTTFDAQVALELNRIEAKNQLLNPTPEKIEEFAIDSEMNYKVVIENQNWVNLDLTEELRSIRAKTLVCSSEKDIVVPTSFTKKIADTISNARLVLFNQSRHFIFLEEQTKFIEHAKSFLSVTD
jgi:proline iminopeptidase